PPAGTAAELPTEPHLVPRIRDAETVGAKNVDAIGLSHRAYLARVMHRHLLGDHEYLPQFRIDTDQLRHAVARRRRRQVDHAAIEAMAVGETLAALVVDRDVAQLRLQQLTLTAGAAD